jgi:hypothetical protein
MSPGFAILVANFIAKYLSGIMCNFFFISGSTCMSCVSCFKMLNLFSVSGSSSVAITTSANFHHNLPISGLFNLSLFHGAPNTKMSLLSHFNLCKKRNVLSNASGSWAKSTKYVTQSFSTFSILPLTPVKLDNDFIQSFISSHICSHTLNAAK